MRILFVNQYYWPDYAATAQQMSDLAEWLVERGHDVHVVCSRGQYDDGTGRPSPKRETRRGVHIHRLRAPGFAKGSGLGRLIDYAGFHLLVGLWLLTRGWRFNAVVTLTTPPLIGIYATALRLLSFGKVRHVCWAMDLHPDLEFDLGMWSPRHPLYALLGRLNDAHFRRASAVVALGEAMAERLAEKGIKPSKLHTISVWNRADQIEPDAPDAAALKREQGFEGKFVVMYSGNAGVIHTFDAVREAMRRLKHDDRFAFVFVGSGKRLPELVEFAEAEGIANFRRLGYFPRERLSASLGMGDAHLVTLRPEMRGVAVPCKTYGIMAAARPVLFVGGPDADTARQVRAGEAGYVVAHDDPDGLVDAMLQLADDPAHAGRLGRNGRAYFEARAERAVCCRAWTELLESLGGAPAKGAAMTDEPSTGASADRAPST